MSGQRLVGPRPKGEQLRQALEQLITELGAGALLPSERILAERYGVARMTVREVLDRLAADALLTASSATAPSSPSRGSSTPTR